MTIDEVRAARERLGLSPEELAAEYGVTEGEVRLWETRPGAIPRRYAKRLAWDVAVKDREERVAASGLPSCPWYDEWEAQLEPLNTTRAEEYVETREAHVSGCETCQALDRFVLTLPPLPEPPGAEWMEVMDRFVGLVGHLPAWARPAAYGATIIGGVTAVRVLAMMAAGGPSWSLLGQAGLGLLVGGYMGAVGGITYHHASRFFARTGRPGPYLTGIVVLLTYLFSFAVPSRYLMEEPTFTGGADWLSLALVAVVVGLLVGHFWFRELAVPRSTPEDLPA